MGPLLARTNRDAMRVGHEILNLKKEVRIMIGERTVMIIGLGYIGNYALEFLARTPGIERIVTSDVSQNGQGKANNAMLGAAQMGFYPEIEFIPLDLFNIDQTATVLDRVKPEVILSTVSLQSYWVISELPPPIFKRLKLECGYGPWIPNQFTLNYKLMQAVKKAGIDTHVITAGFPDATNPILGKVGLTPTIGLGNMDNFVPGIRKLVAGQMEVPETAVTVYLVAHHILRTSIKNVDDVDEIPPFYLGIFVDNKDVSHEFDLKKLLIDETKFVFGWRNDSKVASSGVKNVLAILNNTRQLTHSPGPNGLVGGYPVRLGREGAEIVLPPGITLEEAIKINEQSQVYDGIEKIEDDGTVILTDKAANGMKEILGYAHKRIRVEENEERARELGALYKKALEKYRS